MYRLKKSTDYLKHLLTMINVLSSSVINGIEKMSHKSTKTFQCSTSKTDK